MMLLVRIEIYLLTFRYDENGSIYINRLQLDQGYIYYGIVSMRHTRKVMSFHLYY